MSDQVTVMAHLVARPEKVDETRAFLMSLIERTRAENGCVDYDLHQSDDNPAEFSFYENWISREALDRHMETPYLKELVERKDEFLALEPDVRLMTMISKRK
ncbi:antibiotic biosynthesis monooxygenase [Rhizobium sp. P32RR-XVIII]|uniref:putative quinol monooxygenase n=1 Tax=Rhizobium sp. P32RR-XVIII TaxID=2726738 RepID=UPI001456CAE4|nr:putative quinol monooxygenase [Rhizobium sp. P32RR-XVIII]NLS02946.1 antibiotic biosynthesis monooxygenase [Rhizobium sp. P32RR-XVIII]